MMNCPECGHAAHTRSSYQVSSETKERYNQCQNINCSCTFVSHESVTKIVVKPTRVNVVEPHQNKYQQKTLSL
ncbi:ogr/Delta-like zinc finger family protein [Providencia alcalifaciens]|uniref:Phage transcriptional activator, Ogr/Delta n=1 Tax=Providencia alcalifaciens 205/92 TaxID=1256988 RepID=A0AAV3M585_9GAMM|nr:ogr/Delta-like zinc finger family protein [Providencia alcalifaciens]EUD10877.1 phage transcriptional activator, Ogr/Delta [Providencia alcalifaciens 205/92]MTC64667.1 transcriptional regulator [Providencia alcalifaciens]WGZ53593.1 ogr/Delta-like zinc finger family protein [Providencia alcalifaciens]